MKMIVGLGNPGKQYENTYHNIGFMVLDALNTHFGGKWRRKGKSFVASVFFASKKVMLIKPQTFMNLSGEAVLYFKNKFKIQSQNILTVLDDVDLPVGQLRLRSSGSGGTHNGLKNILALIKTTQMPRLRIGIGKSEKKDLSDFVLSKITKTDFKVLQQSILQSVDKIILEFLADN